MSRRVEPDPFTHSLEIPKKVNLKSILWAKVAETCGGSERMFSSHEKEVLDDIFFSPTLMEKLRKEQWHIFLKSNKQYNLN